MSAPHTSPALEAAIATLEARGGIVRPARISLGGCAEAHGTDRQGAMRRSAHAHTAANDPFRGWLCFKSPNPAVLTTARGLPSRILAHEWAHLALYSGHTEKWRRLMARLGHRADGQKYAVIARIRRVPWVRLATPLHLTRDRAAIKALEDAAPAGTLFDYEGITERLPDGRSAYGGGKWGYVTKYRYVRAES